MPNAFYLSISDKRVLIISDLHLGSPRSNIRAALKILKREKYDLLLILGDLFDGGKLDRLKGRHWAVLSLLRKMTKNRTVLYLTGNHCFLPAKFMGPLLGLTCLETYGMESGGKNFYFVHGDNFDIYCANKKWITKVGTFIKFWLDIIDPKERHVGRLSHWLDHWTNLAKAVRYVALKHAKTYGADWMICGHTHTAEITPGENGKPSYANSGALLDIRDSYLILEKGTLSLHHAHALQRPIPEVEEEPLPITS